MDSKSTLRKSLGCHTITHTGLGICLHFLQGLYEQVLSNPSADQSVTLGNYGILLKDMGLLDESIAALTKALRISASLQRKYNSNTR